MSAWQKLLTASRPHAEGTGSPEADRTAFQRDFDRIVFSSAFRRLQDKTQVHPLPNSDYVRRRLTHSLEVSCVARSLGTHFGQELRQRRDPSLSSIDELAAQVGQIAAAAALAHDIGNPPFGHVGEEAIGNWFRENGSKLPGLSPGQKSDLESFEGNAQGFRILVRLANNGRGLHLTAATLGAFTKYPTCSTARGTGYVGHKKYGFFQAEGPHFEKVANKLGLIPSATNQWKRHPLAFLVEAADDICYRIIDVEDGAKIGRIGKDEAEDCLVAFLNENHRREYDEEKPNVDLGWLRAKAISSLIDATQKAFIDNEEAILSGTFSEPLLKHISRTKELANAQQLVKDQIFAWDRTIKAEIAGARMLTLLLDDFIDAALNPSKSLNAKLLSLIPDFRSDAALYDRTLAITDYISGMTDNFLVQTYRQVHGHSLSGG
jgi:dGTPase